MPRIPRLLALVATLSLLVGLSACLSSDDDDDGDTTPTIPTFEPPTTADEAMEAFVEYYESGDLDFYGRLLHDGFVFVDHDGVERDRAWELAVSEKILGGLPGSGGIAIESIAVAYVNPLGVWEAVPAEDPYFGGVADAVFRPYDVLIRFKVDGANLYFEVSGLVIVYALEVDGGYYLLGFRDMTNGQKATESVSWTGVKSLFD